MLVADAVEAVYVALPHHLLAPIAMQVLGSGRHVLVEKPAGVYTKQVREMNEEAKKHNVVFAMMFNQRTNHIYRKMRELVQSGKYGQIRRTNWLITNWYRSQFYYNSGSWRATWSGEGGGVLLNQCPHQLDLWQWICGMPKRVHAHLHYGLWHDIEVEDDVTAYVEYENGATGVFITSTGDACGSNRFEIQMDKAKLVAENDVLTVTEYAVSEPEFTRTNKSPFARPEKVEFQPETDGQNPQHAGVISAWGKAIRNDGCLIAGGEEGINGLTLANAMYLSDWLGKTIDIPFDEDVYYEELMKRVATSRRKVVKETVVEDMSASFGEKK
jgi:predicted dehydrogenase